MSGSTGEDSRYMVTNDMDVKIQQGERLLKAEQFADEKSAMLAAIVDSSDDAIISKSTKGIIMSWNLGAQRIFGFSGEEMIGEPITKFIPEDRLDEELEILSLLWDGHRVDHFETKRISKEGLLIDVSLTISPVKNKKGSIIGFSKIARDITHKKLEEKRKKDFIQIASHELKTPLTSMLSYVQLALAKARSSSDNYTENLLSRAEAHTLKMTRMIHEFLNLSRLENGQMSLNRTKFSLPELMNELIFESEILAYRHIIDYSGCADLKLYADREKVGHVLTNLLSNAVKYSKIGTTISIVCACEQNNVQISFTDQGIGIDPLDQRRLFERFYRVEDERLQHISGFGIGLYLASEILKLHGSEIVIKSEPAKGSTFSFALPFITRQD